MSSTRAALTALAAHHGFDIRFAAVGPTPRMESYEAWLADGLHGDLAWMERGREVRGDPRRRLPDAKTAMVLALNHHWRAPPDPGGRTGRVARYAWGRDYHNLIGKRLKKLRRALREQGIASWGGVDTAPILERAWAAAAGLGFSGKNTMQIRVGSTSWFFLAVVFIDVSVTPDRAVESDHCGTCRRCLDICPTHAFVAPYRLDASRCISYWTIESRALPPRELRAGFSRWVFGCDLCQEVCPHNHRPPDEAHHDFLPRHAWLDLDDLLDSSDDALMERFRGTPLRRPGAAGLKRNAALVLGNLGDDAAVDVLRRSGISHADPVVRGASVWALQRLGAEPPVRDHSPIVQAEIDACSETR